MAVFNGAFPVLKGKEDLAKKFADEIAGPRKGDFDAMQKKSSVTRETWTLQETPMGSFVLVWFEGDVEAAFADMATSDDEIAKWMRDRIQELTGVDMAADDSPPPAVLLDWTA